MTYTGTIIKDLLSMVDDCLQSSACAGWRATARPDTQRESQRPSADRLQNEGDLEPKHTSYLSLQKVPR